MSIVICPQCKGAGMLTAVCILSLSGEPRNPPLEFQCIGCRGVGRVTLKRRAKIEAVFAKAEKLSASRDF